MATDLFGLTYTQLNDYFDGINEKSFHAKQVFRWMHVSYASDFSCMSNLSKTLREKLVNTAKICVPVNVCEYTASDAVIKWIITLDDNNKIETVYIPEADRATLCISSQVGCALECKFCSTARQGFNRNLTTGEIVGQLWWANKRLNEIQDQIGGKKRITNVVMMGMGEPLANYNNVVNALKIMLDDNGYGIAKKRLTLSTSGIAPSIERLSVDCPVALAISLHASNDAIRSQIIPLNNKYPIAKLMDSCKVYVKNNPKFDITFEYVMLNGINDDIKHAHELANIVKGIPCKFNLIPFNPFPQSGFNSSSMETILAFQSTLKKMGFITTIRKTRGDKINAACGQLVGQVQDKTKRQWKIHAQCT